MYTSSNNPIRGSGQGVNNQGQWTGGEQSGAVDRGVNNQGQWTGGEQSGAVDRG